MRPLPILSTILLPITIIANALVSIPSNSFGIPGKNSTYDYVVVGGGTAGNAIAARLASDPSISVGVIEAGGFYEIDNGNGSVIPALSFTQYVGWDPEDTQPLIDWGFVTTPQAGAGGRRMHYARGKTLGGSSARNYLAYHRGTVGSHERWADDVGDPLYAFSNFDKYFKRSAHLTPPNVQTRFPNSTVQYDPDAFQASGGPLAVTWPNYALPLYTYAGKALAAIGVPISKIGFNSGVLSGSAWATATMDPDLQHRSSSETSYLRMAMRETSIKVYTQAMAEQILFEHSTGKPKANGVLVRTAGKQFTLHANKEVIVSAGAFQSPQLLMVSGIGPLDTLQAHGIKPLLRNGLQGVGQGLQDQPLFGVSYRVNVPTASAMVNSPVAAAMAAEAYKQNQTGPLTAPAGFLAWEKLPQASRSGFAARTEADLAAFPSDWPEVEYLFLNAYIGYSRNYMNSDPMDGHNYATIAMALVATTSRGNVSISSANMHDPPVINPNWLTTDTDAEVAVAAFKRVRETWAQLEDVTIGGEYFPGARVQTDAEILAFLRQELIMLYHAAATCKMGKADDKMAVLDPQARVYGIDGLRVVDASSFPFLPPGHPQATIYALAEKIAEDIQQGR